MKAGEFKKNLSKLDKNWKLVDNKLEIKLYTHDKGKITELDFKLAKIIDDKLYLLK